MAFAPVVHTRTCERHARGCSQIKSEALVKRDVYLVIRDVYMVEACGVRQVCLVEACGGVWRRAGMEPRRHAGNEALRRATPVPAFLSPPSSLQG